MFWLVSVWSKLNNHKKIVGQKSLKILAFGFEIDNIFAILYLFKMTHCSAEVRSDSFEKDIMQKSVKYVHSYA